MARFMFLYHFLLSNCLFRHSTLAFSPQPKITSTLPTLSPNSPLGTTTSLLGSKPDRIGKQTILLSSKRSERALKSSLELDAGTSKALDTYQQESPITSDSVWAYMQTSDIVTKLGNALLLAVCFGFAAYTILTIDSGMTRGWTSGEIAIRLPIDNWLNYENSLADRPIFTKTAINVIIYLLGDWLSQTVFLGKNVLDFDAGRTLRNGLIGLFFGPLVHEYYQFSDHILPVEGGMWNRLEKICMDQTVYLTVKCSIYIAAVGFLNGEDTETVKTNVQTKLPGIVVTAWKFWPLVHMVTYGVIPARHRILWVNCVDLFWNAILAGMSQAKEEDIVVTAEESTTSIVVESREQQILAASALEVSSTPSTNTTIPDTTAVDDKVVVP